MIHELKVIILESSSSENYIGGSTFSEVNAFLESKRFTLSYIERFGDERPKQLWLPKLMKSYEPNFN